MIASLTGTVEHIGLDQTVLLVGGVGLAVRATPATLAALRVGSSARLATTLVVRDDSLTLMGFETDDERDTFETLQTVSGIGPKVALAMLAVHTPDALRRAVAEADHAALQRVPGIGKKGAQRIVLEIGEKLGPPHEVPEGSEAGSADVAGDAATGAATGGGERAEPVIEALTGLGWQQAAAATAVETVLAELEGAGEGAALDTAALLRAALQRLGGGRRG